MLNAYMGYSRSTGSAEGACLIFAKNGKEAKKAGFPCIHDWFGSDWTDMAVKRLDKPHLFSEANPAKLEAEVPHVIDCPNVCQNCHQWGGIMGDDGKCEFCCDDDS